MTPCTRGVVSKLVRKVNFGKKIGQKSDIVHFCFFSRFFRFLVSCYHKSTTRYIKNNSKTRLNKETKGTQRALIVGTPCVNIRVIWFIDTYRTKGYEKRYWIKKKYHELSNDNRKMSYRMYKKLKFVEPIEVKCIQ